VIADAFPKEVVLAFAAILGLLGIGLLYTAAKPLFARRFGIGVNMLLVLLSPVGLGILAVAFYVGSLGI
jgi:hypothetical protein